uniref:Uncharacterized protein n=1 Tax=Brassica oleracea var. oleracea TaxID=109376 RepID=A0A0D3D3E1_BRAOL
MTCSSAAVICMNFVRGRLWRNFFTSLDSSITSPKAEDFEDISASFPEKSSMVSVSFILIRLNSSIKVCRRASRTLSAPTCLDLISSHTSLDVLRLPTCRIRCSSIDWNKRALAISLLSPSSEPRSIDSQTLCTLSATCIRMLHTV